jgi:hypothetical protein
MRLTTPVVSTFVSHHRLAGCPVRGGRAYHWRSRVVYRLLYQSGQLVIADSLNEFYIHNLNQFHDNDFKRNTNIICNRIF